MAILDQWGNAVFSTFKAAEPQALDRPFWHLKYEDIEKSITKFGYKQIISDSRRLYANFGPIKTAICDKAMFSVGRSWMPVYLGRNKEFGQQATKLLIDQWYKLCDVRGDAYDFQTGLYLESISVDRCGDYGTALIKTADGYPQIQYIPNHRIGCRDYADGILPDGPYKGLKLCNGVVINQFGRAVAYYVLGDDASQDRFVSARDMMLTFDPEWFDQNRGLPGTTHGILDLRDLMTNQDYEKQACMLASSIGLLEWNDDGTADVNNPAEGLTKGVRSDGSPFYTKMMAGGAIRYMKAGSGQKIETMKNDRPSDSWHGLQDRLLRTSINPIWPYELTWSAKEIGGVNVRQVINRANRLIEDRQDLLELRAARKVRFAIACFQNIGELPADEDWFMWGFTKPPKMTADDGHYAQERRADYMAGIGNLSEILAEKGKTTETHLRERIDDVVLRKQLQEEAFQKTGIKVEDRDMILLTPNEQPDGEVGKGDQQNTTNQNP